jgi:hypothetical protein
VIECSSLCDNRQFHYYLPIVRNQESKQQLGYKNYVPVGCCAMQKTTQLQNAKASTTHDKEDITLFSSTLHVVESENNEKHQLKWVVEEE